MVRASQRRSFLPLMLLGCATMALMRGGGPARAEAGRPPADAAVPFAVGEQLEYRVGQNFLTAATAQLRVVDRKPFSGRNAWHFQARAQTVDPVRLLYTLDDQFDSYTDAATLAGLQYVTHVRETRRQEDAVVRMSNEGDAASGDQPSVRVPAGTRDPLGALYALRATDWAGTETLTLPVYDGKKLYEMRVRRLERGEEVEVAAGTYDATRLELRLFERGRETQGTRFQVWISEDPRRLPVLIEAELPFGTFRVELERVR